MNREFKRLCLLVIICNLSACSFTGPKDGAPKRQVNVAGIPNATPRVEPRSSAGNPSSYRVFGKTYHVMNSSDGYVERGIASWYGTKFHGRKTSNGETYDMYKMTAAHTRLPIPSYVQVTNLKNGRRIIVRVNDRGPFHPNRIIDLSYVAAKKLGITATGTGLVEVRNLDPHNWNRKGHLTSTSADASSIQPGSFDKLYIQAGAFTSRYNALNLRNDLAELFPNNKVSLAFNQSDRFYRVHIGPIHSVDEADQIAQTISDNGYPDPHVIIE